MGKTMVFGGFLPVDAHKAHAHEYNFIESFAAQDHHALSTAQRHEQIMDTLRNQYYNQNADVDKHLCYRHCFKFSERKYAEFCLQRNCGGADFNVAAKEMGYLK